MKMDQIIIFDKSFQQRLQEYMDVLSGYEILPASQVKKEWGYYLELVIDPNGWQAVWKIPRLVCEKLKILYPTIVLVYIENVNFKDLTAFIKILAVQDNIHLPESHIVPLVQLWATKQQDDTVGLNLPATANAIDMLHFFYNHLWMPWDNDEEENIDWISKNLEIRLRLHYDIKMGVIPRNTAEHLRSLLNEAKALQAKRERVEEQISDEDDIEITDSPNDKNVLNESIQTLMDFHIRMTQIKSEVEILENPVLRAALIRRKNNSFPNGSDMKTVPEYWLIFKNGLTTNSYFEYLKLVKEILPDETTCQTAISVQKALEFARPNDILLICSGTHTIHSACSLEEGGTLKGLELDNTKTEITSSNENIMLDFSGKEVLLENISFNVGIAQCGTLVRKGHVALKNCLLTGKGLSSIHQGIIVLADAELYLENCTISGFATGIVANTGSKVTLLNCTISDVEIAVKLYDKSEVDIQKCVFSKCKQYAINIETDLDDFKQDITTGDISILENLSQIKATECSFINNETADVTITKKQKILPVRDLFSNPKFEMTLNSSIYENSNKENMEI